MLKQRQENNSDVKCIYMGLEDFHKNFNLMWVCNISNTFVPAGFDKSRQCIIQIMNGKQ